LKSPIQTSAKNGALLFSMKTGERLPAPHLGRGLTLYVNWQKKSTLNG
jgi:hypothetical protein